MLTIRRGFTSVRTAKTFTAAAKVSRVDCFPWYPLPFMNDSIDVRPRHIHYLTSNTLKKPSIKLVKICSKCNQKISLSDRKKHRCSSTSLSHSVYKRKTNAHTQQTTTHSTPTFQQHVRDHALNAKVDVHCPYCVMHSSSRPIERRSMKTSQSTVHDAEVAMDRLKQANRPSKTLPLYSLSTSKPPMKLEFNKKHNLQDQLQVSMVACVVDPKQSSKLESGKMNH